MSNDRSGKDSRTTLTAAQIASLKALAFSPALDDEEDAAARASQPDQELEHEAEPEGLHARIRSISPPVATLQLGADEAASLTVPTDWLPAGSQVGTVLRVTIIHRPEAGKAVWVELTREGE